MQTIAQVHAKPDEDDPLQQFKQARDFGVTTMYVQGGCADQLVKNQQIDWIQKALEFTRKFKGFLDPFYLLVFHQLIGASSLHIHRGYTKYPGTNCSVGHLHLVWHAPGNDFKFTASDLSILFKEREVIEFDILAARFQLVQRVEGFNDLLFCILFQEEITHIVEIPAVIIATHQVQPRIKQLMLRSPIFPCGMVPSRSLRL